MTLAGKLLFDTAKGRHFEADLFSVVDGRHSVREWHGNCDNPIPLTAWGSTDNDFPFREMYEQITMVRCRKCDGCRRFYLAQVVTKCGEWAKEAPRTWAVCNTVDDRWNLKWSEDYFVRQLQLYLKRVRACAPFFRYAWVVEYQRRGAPHAHLLMFEVSEPLLFRHIQGRRLKTQNGRLKPKWPWGNTKITECKNVSNAAWYLIKYLRKDPGSRFRRSIGRQPRTPPQGEG